MLPHPADILPWSHATAADVIALTDGGWLAIWQFMPCERELATDLELEAGRYQISQITSSLPGDVCLWLDRERYSSDDGLPVGRWPHPRLAAMAAERDQRNKGHLRASHHLSMAFWPDRRRRERRLLEVFSEPESIDASALYGEWCRLIERAEDLFAGLFGELDRLSGDRLAAHLAGLVNDRAIPAEMPALPVELARHWTASEIVTGDRPQLGDRDLRTVTIADLPSSTMPRMLAMLDELEVPYRWSVRWQVLSADQARQEIVRARRSVMGRLKSLMTALFEKMLGVETEAAPDALSYLDECYEAEATLAEAGLGWGYATMVVVAWSDDDAQAIRNVLTSAGLSANVSSLTTIDNWLASLPGKRWAAAYRRLLVSTLTLADLAPVFGELPIANTPPLLQCGSIRLGFGSGAGHGLIVGPSGSGKSMLAALLGACHLREPGARSIIIDRHASARSMIEACGGDWRDAVALQPLRDAGAHATAWTHDALLARGMVPSACLDREVAAMIAVLASLPPEERTLSAACTLMGSAELRDCLMAYAVGGLFGRLFEGRQDMADDYLIGIEIAAWPQAARPLAALALAQALERLVSDMPRPTWLMIDEAALALRETSLGLTIEGWFRTMRKFGCRVWIATQSAQDMLDAGFGVITGQLDHRVWLPNPHAREAQEARAYEALGCSDRLLEVIATATPRRHYLWQTEVGARCVDLDLGPLQLETLAHRRHLNQPSQPHLQAVA